MSDNKSDSAVEDLSLAMIREYLHTRGYKKSLATLSDELPVKPTPTTRSAMTKELGLSRMLAKNKKRETPYPTLIEVVTRYLYDKRVEADVAAATNGGSVPIVAATTPSPTSSNTNVTSSTVARSSTSATIARTSTSNDALSRRPESATSRGQPMSMLGSAPSTISSRPASATSRVVMDMQLQELDFDDEPAATRATSVGHKAEAKSTLPPSSSSSSSTPSVPLSTFRSVPISGEEAVQIRDVVFGRREVQGKFPSCWTKQGFFFRPTADCKAAPSLAMGLWQNEGGPCGLLAAVQSFFIKDLLFKSPSSNNDSQRQLLSVNAAQQRASLINAISEMLWMVSGGGTVRVAYPSSTSRLTTPPKNYRSDGITETMTIYQLTSLTELRSFISSSFDLWNNPKGLGAISLLYSLVLTRGITNVQSDKDDEWQVLVVDGGYCTQELVNLALTGRATSNVFDATKVVDGKTYRGVERKSSIGFLSRFELAGNVLVGSNYKQPEYPIWVVCSESHYSVLWALCKSTGMSTPYGAFDLWYYDELAQQTEEIRLSLDTRITAPLPKSRDPEPPINECIRTRWGPTTRVDWNGVDPIL